MSISKVTVLVSALALTACGTAKKEEASNKSPVISEQDAKAEGAKLPAVALIRVPVGADGKELHDNAEMRLVTNGQTISNDTIASTFDSASAPTTVIDELDQTSSTDSFFGWLGCGRGYRNSYYGNSYYGGGVSWNWQFYRPTYLNYGYTYGYSYGGSYGNHYGNGAGYPASTYPNTGTPGTYPTTGAGNNGYNYYQYNQNFGQTGYSNQGWNPSQTYTGGVY